MKKALLFLFTIILIGSEIFADVQRKRPIIIMGVLTVIYEDEKVKFAYCPPPEDSVCITVPEGAIAPAYNVGRFYHNPDNKFLGFGYTDIDVEFTGEPFYKHSISENPNNIMINNYQEWLNYFNLINLFE